MRISELLAEGVNDPSIFKCVFVVGGPGSGKSQVASMLGLNAMGFVTINSDQALEYLMKKHGLSLKMPPEEEEKRTQVRTSAKGLTSSKMDLAMNGRLGLVIDSTGENLGKLQSIKEKLSRIGYDFFLVAVEANLETALRRNAARPRSVPEDIVKQKWTGVHENWSKLISMFPNNVVIDNNGNLGQLSKQTDQVHVKIAQWAQQDPKSLEALVWIQNELPQSSKK